MVTTTVNRVGIERERPAATARLTLLACVAAVAVLVTQLPGPVEVLTVLTGAAGPSAGGPMAAVQDILLITAGLLAWLLAGWAVLVLGVGLITRLPGRPGRRARRLLPRIAPASVGRLVLAAVGVSLIAGTAACATPASPGATAGAATASAATASAATASAATASAAPTPSPAPPPSSALPSGSFTIDWPAPGPSPAPDSPASTAPAPTPTSAASSAPSPVTTAPTSTTATSTPAPSPAAPSTPAPSPGNAAGGTATPSRPPVSSTADSVQAPPGPSTAPDSAPASSPSGQPSTDATSAVVAQSAGTPTASGETVTVHAGDSLWRIAADALGPDATASEVDNAWRAWYFVNREVVGDDPDVILPGQSLVAPSAEQVRP